MKRSWWVKMKTTEQRFEGRFQKGPDCWNWLGGKWSNGYGRIRNGLKGRLLAHRVSYEIHIGPISDGLWVLHKCDNRACVNPEHLFLGTNLDNIRDMIAKRRNSPPPHPRGEENVQSKLTSDQVRQIRIDGRTERDIAKSFGVSKSLIGPIKHRKIWRHV